VLRVVQLPGQRAGRDRGAVARAVDLGQAAADCARCHVARERQRLTYQLVVTARMHRASSAVRNHAHSSDTGKADLPEAIRGSLPTVGPDSTEPGEPRDLPRGADLVRWWQAQPVAATRTRLATRPRCQHRRDLDCGGSRPVSGRSRAGSPLMTNSLTVGQSPHYAPWPATIAGTRSPSCSPESERSGHA
jgi:hypothetical protein